MEGNDEIRFCSHCAKSVHNLSAMTRNEARKLVAQSNGNLCVRYIKRPDGKIQTTDRSLYQTGKRAAQIAAGVFGATLSLSAFAYAQNETIKPKQGRFIAVKSDKDKTDSPTGFISGTVRDSYRGDVAGARITLTDTKNNQTQTTQSNDEGFYEFKNLAPSVYQIEAQSNGFALATVTEIELSDSKRVDLALEVASSELVGELIVVTDYKVEMVKAASTGDKIQLRKLIALGKDVNEKDRDSHGQTALHVAAETGDLEIVQMLIEAKADVNITDEYGATALMIAAQDNELEIARVLLEAGANPNLKNVAGDTAMRRTYSAEIKQLLRQYGAKE